MAENFDAQIEQKLKEIEELKKAKEAEVKRQEGLAQLDEKLKGFYAEFSLSEDDYFAFKQKDFEKWLKAESRVDGRKKKAVATTGPKLKVGKYRNPNTQEVIEKIKRNPKPLDQWIEQYGFSTVEGWLVD